MRERRLLTLDEDALRAQAGDLARRIDRVPDPARAERPAEADRDRRRGGAGELRGAGQGAPRIGGQRAAGAGERARSPSFAPRTTTSTTRISSSTIRARDACGTGKTRSSTSRTRSTNARARLTLTGPSREAAFGAVLLFRSRFFAPATHSPRFYREYFKPAREREIEKDRRRWLVGISRRRSSTSTSIA